MLSTSTVAALASLAVLAPAAAAAPRETVYAVTVEAEMVERWSFDEHESRLCGVDVEAGRCDRDAVGRGSARIFLRTPRPQRVRVTTGVGGMQPLIVSSIDRGIPLTGSYRRAGSFTDTWSGSWDAANPDHVAATSGCGVHRLKTDLALGWSGRGAIRPVVSIGDLADCPTGPPSGFDHDGIPALTEVPARLSERKPGRVKQFRIAGTKSWRGTIAPVSRTDPDDTYLRTGASEIRWSWEATFRKVTRPAARAAASTGCRG